MRQQGFTIVELMIVVTLMGIIAALAIPGFGNTIKNHQLRSTADDYYAAIRYARAEAVRTRRPITIEQKSSDWSKGLEIKDSAGVVLRDVRAKGKLAVSEGSGISSINFDAKGFLSSEVEFNFCSGPHERQIKVLVSGFSAVLTGAGC